MSWFSSLVSSAVSQVQAVAAAAQQLAALDNLQDEFGDRDGRKALFAGLDLTFVAPRLVAMGFPATPATHIRSRNDAAAVAQLLRERAGASRAMIWNLSEEPYDGALFDEQVVEVRFPGYPSPPLGLLVRVCTSIEGWLNADPRNVAVVHCMTGRGRTAVVCACLMAWMAGQPQPAAVGEASAAAGAAAAEPAELTEPAAPLSAMEALVAVAAARGVVLESLCAPSQVRYVQYFGLLLEGVRLRAHAGDGQAASLPATAGLVLRRVILNGVPDMTLPLDEAYAAVARAAASAARAAENSAAARAAAAAAAGPGAADEDKAGDAEGLSRGALATPDALVALLPASATRLGQRLGSMLGGALQTLGAGGAGVDEDRDAQASGGLGGDDGASEKGERGMLGTVLARIEGGVETLARFEEAGDRAILAVAGRVAGGVSSALDSAARRVSEATTGSSAAAAGTAGPAAVVPAAGAQAPAAASLPAAAAASSATAADGGDDSIVVGGCRPYLQLFNNGQLVFSSLWQAQQAALSAAAASASAVRAAAAGTAAGDAAGADQPTTLASASAASSVVGGLRWCSVQESSVRFSVDVPVFGDVLVRCRHQGDGGMRESLFRAAFHTGHLSGYVLRLSRRQLDVAAQDPRTPPDFFVEFVFAPRTFSDSFAGSGAQAALADEVLAAASAPGRTIGDAQDKDGDDVSPAEMVPSARASSAAVSAASAAPAALQTPPGDFNSILLGTGPASAAFWADVERRKAVRTAAAAAAHTRQLQLQVAALERQRQALLAQQQQEQEQDHAQAQAQRAQLPAVPGAGDPAAPSLTAPSAGPPPAPPRSAFMSSLSSLVAVGLAQAQQLGREVAEEAQHAVRDAQQQARALAASAQAQPPPPPPTPPTPTPTTSPPPEAVAAAGAAAAAVPPAAPLDELAQLEREHAVLAASTPSAAAGAGTGTPAGAAESATAGEEDLGDLEAFLAKIT